MNILPFSHILHNEKEADDLTESKDFLSRESIVNTFNICKLVLQDLRKTIVVWLKRQMMVELHFYCSQSVQPYENN